MFEQLDTPEPTPRQIEDEKATERRIEDAVYTRMRDPAYVIDALSVLITDNPMTQRALSNIIMGYGDMVVSVGNLRCDVRAHLLEQVRRDAERGKI
jgi:beta-galactosidase/beta-glucuronidase